jgi:SAM-dependent methyltransferase
VRPKPKQFGTEYAAIFKDESVASAYSYRPPYPLQIAEILLSLLPDAAGPNIVLDAGCGPGNIARSLVQWVDQVDAVDFSAAMVRKGRCLPGGDDPKLHWICSPIETAPLRPSYNLIVAAASLHWMDWPVVLPRFADHLVADGYLALVEETHQPQPWDKEIGAIFAHFSMNRDFEPYNLMTISHELVARGLFEIADQREVEPISFRQSLAEWVESIHARNGFSRDRMDPQAAQVCDAELARVLAHYCPAGVVEQQVGARVLWGRPLHPPAASA